MAEQAELAFVKTFLNTLSTQPIVYADNYQQPSENSLKRVPVLPIPVPPQPERKKPTASSSSAAPLSLTFKSLKPAASYTISVQPTDTIANIKSQLAAQPSAPPPDAQRLLIKGKALVDSKLLKEYNIQDGATINLMLKPGSDWDPTKPTPKPQEIISPTPIRAQMKASPSSLDPNVNTKTGAGGRKHQRIPSVVLSPSPSTTPGMVEKDIMLTLDAGTMPSPILQPESLSTYHAVVAKPEYWQRLYAFLKSEFLNESDLNLAFEDYLCASKGSLTASEIAKIRDHVGVVGMAGT